MIKFTSLDTTRAALKRGGVAIVLLAASFAPGGTLRAQSANPAAIPNLSSPKYGWIKQGVTFAPLPSGGPGPITSDPLHPYQPNNRKGLQTTYPVADLSNPILNAWAKARMKITNAEVIAGKVPFRARTSCWPAGVPGILIYGRGEPVYFVQSPKEVVILNQADMQTRHIYLNVPHSAHPAPSWYGESVGHYEGGDTLVVDTIGENARTFIDDYRTPHTTRIHVVERYKLTDGGKTIRVRFTVEDPGAFTVPWSAMQTFHRVPWGPLLEAICAEDRVSPFRDLTHPIPQAKRPDF
jgi:hypothetical protein